MDEAAIAAALGARFTGLTPPSGETAAQVYTDWPNVLGEGPFILIDGNPEDDYEWGPALTRHGESEWRVVFARAQIGDYGPRLNALRSWRPVLRDRIVGQIQLGLSYVDFAELTGMSAAREVIYAETPYDGFEMRVRVRSREQVAAQA